jgi:hypothetical protein
MGWVKYLVYIASFFVPVFGFITFWVFSGREDEMQEVAKVTMAVAFFGALVYIILAALGMTVFSDLFRGMGWWSGWPR